MKRTSFALALVVMTAPFVSADWPGRQPHYLHALADLRYARYLLNRPGEFNQRVDQREALANIDRAMEELRHAGIDDHKKENDHRPVDNTLDRMGRLRRAAELLESAHRYLNYEAAHYSSLEWRVRAIERTGEALQLTRYAMGEAYRKH